MLEQPLELPSLFTSSLASPCLTAPVSNSKGVNGESRRALQFPHGFWGGGRLSLPLCRSLPAPPSHGAAFVSGFWKRRQADKEMPQQRADVGDCQDQDLPSALLEGKHGSALPGGSHHPRRDPAGRPQRVSSPSLPGL